MTSKWEYSTLGDILTLQRGMDLPVQERKGGKHPIVASNGVVGFHDEAPVKAPGVVIGRSGSIGGGQFIEQDFWPLNTTLWVKDFKGNDSRFCYYLLKSIDFSSMNAGSGVPTLNRNHLHPMRVAKPPVSVQKSISGILGSLDDRITLLRETNVTLEAIAQAMFKSWFVDFDPVRAKSEGKLPEGIDEATAALFPDTFKQTEIGRVPKGWQVSSLSSLAAFQNGYAFKGSDWVEQGHPVIKIGNVKPLLIDFDGCSYVSPETVLALDPFKLNRGDLLVGMTGYVGETGLVTQTEVDSYLNQRVGRIVTTKSLDDLGFLFAAVRQAEFKAYAESQSHGSAQANVSGADLMKFSVVIPPAQVLDTFNQVAGKLIEKIIDNYEEAKTLVNLRDTLLPRLISGQLRVADDKEEIEKVSA